MCFVIPKKRIFFTALFWLLLWLSISKMICKGAPMTFLITQNGEKVRKICQSDQL